MNLTFYFIFFFLINLYFKCQNTVLTIVIFFLCVLIIILINLIWKNNLKYTNRKIYDVKCYQRLSKSFIIL